MSDAERLERIQKVFPDREEAQAILEYDKMVDATEKEILEHDLSPEKKKIAQRNCHAGVRKPVVYKFNTPKKRKENATKSKIIAELAHFLEENSEFETSDVQITNKEKEILLKICGQWYSVTLTYRRNMNK